MREKYDEYDAKIATLGDSIEKVDLLNQYAWELSRVDPNRANSLSNEANLIAESLGYEKGIAESKKNQGQCLWLLADYAEALQLCTEVLPDLERLDLKKSASDTVNIIGALYSHMGDTERALQYYNKCAELKHLIGDKSGEVRALNSIGDQYLRLKNYALAEQQFLRCQAIEHDHDVLKGIVLYNMGELYFHMGNNEKADDFLKMGIEIGKEINFPLMQVYCQSMQAQIAEKNKDPEGALVLLKDALLAAEKVEAKDRIYSMHEAISRVYKSMGNTEKAFEHYEFFHIIKEEVYNQENTDRLKSIEVHHRTLALQKEAEMERNKNIELKKANEEIRNQRLEILDQNKSITDSINYAKNIQLSILPQRQVLQNEFDDAFVLYKPKDIVSGDFYWFDRINDHTILVVADCTGHGVPGAFMSIIGNNFLNQIVTDQSITSPSTALMAMDEKLAHMLRNSSKDFEANDGMDLAFISYDHSNNILQFAGAKNALFLVRDKELKVYKGDLSPIGGRDIGIKTFNNHKIEVKKGDCIYLSTDGYPDQFGGPKGKKFMLKRFKELMISSSGSSMTDQKQLFTDTFENWKNVQDQVDDVCVIGVRI